MWPFSSKSSYNALGTAQGMTDWHCHLLPGVDDGVRTMKETLAILDEYDQRGVKKVWFTPHIMEDVPNTTQALRDRFEEVKEKYQGPIELRLAAENMMDNLFEERLAAGDLLPLGVEGHHLLVETSYFSGPVDLEDILERVKKAGYIPVLAHPERYVYMELSRYDRLKEMNILFQLNLFSLSGGYGQGVMKKGEYLLKKGYYNLTGTDTHAKRQFLAAFDSKQVSSGVAKRLTPLPTIE